MNKHIKSDKAKWAITGIVLVLVIVTVVGMCLQLFGQGKVKPSEWFEKDVPVENIPSENNTLSTSGLNINIPETENGLMKLSAVAYASAENPFVKTLTATVIGDSDNKNVSWTLEWQEGSSRSNEAVNTYISTSIEATSTGSIITLQCLKGFEGDVILVTATTAIGGFSKTCTLTFDGAPTALKFDLTGMKVVRDSSLGIDLVELECGSDYSFNVSLDNAIHSVGSRYGNYTMTFEMIGSLNTTWKYVNNYNTSTADDIAVRFNAYGDYVYVYADYVKDDGTADWKQINEKFCKVMLNGNSVVVSPILPITVGSEYYAGADRGGRKYCTVKNYANNKTPYVKVTVTDTVSGLSSSINIKNVSSVSGVSLNTSSIQF